MVFNSSISSEYPILGIDSHEVTSLNMSKDIKHKILPVTKIYDHQYFHLAINKLFKHLPLLLPNIFIFALHGKTSLSPQNIF